ncbi:hypothetical protein ACH5RR_012291 [Cinchona calisaya]|uniref:Uncharacterized protein n=1 Tax=Cinchona calisaya TaxID=153742 RepID=A0ABD3AAR0_9GENT
MVVVRMGGGSCWGSSVKVVWERMFSGSGRSSPYHSNVFVSKIVVSGGDAEAWDLFQELDLVEFNFLVLVSWVCASVCFDLGGMASEQSMDKITNVLEKFSLSAKELEGICLEEDDDVSRSKNTSQKSLFGRIVGDKMANFVGVKNFVNHVWGYPRELVVVELRANLFQFIFGSVED